jgi:hypothetical protein
VVVNDLEQALAFVSGHVDDFYCHETVHMDGLAAGLVMGTKQEIRMGSGEAGKGMGNSGSTGHQTAGTNDTNLPDESEVTQQIPGNNQLAGND